MTEAIRKEGVSYTNVVAHGGGSPAPLIVFPSECRMIELKGCYVGFLRHHSSGISVQHRMCLEGINKIRVTPMGGLMVLLQSDIQGEIFKVVENHKVWWEELFYRWTPWTPNLVAKRRVVWLKISGLPPHVWEEGTFKLIGACFGMFLDFDEATFTRQSLEVARLKIDTARMEWICEQLSINVMGAVFVLNVVEDAGVEKIIRVVEIREWEDCASRSSAASGDSGDEEVVGTTMRVHFDEGDDISPTKLNPTQLGVKVACTCLKST